MVTVGDSDDADRLIVRDERAVTSALSSRMRALRLERGLTLRQVSSKAQISPSLLSQIERGGANPSLLSLVAIADALMVRPGQLLDDDAGPSDSPVVRRDERHVLEGLQCRREYLMHVDDPYLEVAELFLRPGGCTRQALAKHSGRDYGIVLEGDVTVEFETNRYVLSMGDYIAFEADRPHRLVNHTEQDARVIWVIAHNRRSARQAA